MIFCWEAVRTLYLRRVCFGVGGKAEYVCSSFSLLGFPGGSVGKEFACNEGDLVWSLGWEDSWRREWLPTPVVWPGEFHGQRSLAGYRPWGRKESLSLWVKVGPLVFYFTYTYQVVYSEHLVPWHFKPQQQLSLSARSKRGDPRDCPHMKLAGHCNVNCLRTSCWRQVSTGRSELVRSDVSF